MGTWGQLPVFPCRKSFSFFMKCSPGLIDPLCSFLWHCWFADSLVNFNTPLQPPPPLSPWITCKIWASLLLLQNGCPLCGCSTKTWGHVYKLGYTFLLSTYQPLEILHGENKPSSRNAYSLPSLLCSSQNCKNCFSISGLNPPPIQGRTHKPLQCMIKQKQGPMLTDTSCHEDCVLLFFIIARF